jgi:hypothetical protein
VPKRPARRFARAVLGLLNLSGQEVEIQNGDDKCFTYHQATLLTEVIVVSASDSISISSREIVESPVGQKRGLRMTPQQRSEPGLVQRINKDSLSKGACYWTSH